ncbi:rod shape-determining protein RodA [Alkalihalobacterium chitinilyticum]|uniref:Rod shape-determining protein RodA n=1 Tax=Alkalihalobacterium chitinilyticum TaxID=2980103 RepID=A0ABT5VME6_9BACI|nr:rod shape-determining protein RodA [Alkalihalobacterium chitinilyticum]MDE5415663.1 rod shape-determining protein RodA [Alkalihalobacterium chitinilyticum]
MEERKSGLQQIDYTLLFLFFLLMCISLMAIYSGSGGQYTADPMQFVKRQVIWIVPGLFLMVAAMVLDYDMFKNFSIPLYILGILLLLWVEFFGVVFNGSQRWIQIAGQRFQPSEFVKVFVVIALAHLLYKITKDGREKSFKSDCIVVAKVVAVGLPPFFLILKQPDLGTALVIGSIMATMILMSGVGWRMLSLLVVSVISGIGFLVWLHNNYFAIFNKIIKNHQMERIYGWLYPNENAGSYGYQLVEALKGIGAGGLYGSGFMQGVQSQSEPARVPELHTDFIFTVIGEEFGFLGATILIVIYFLMFYRMIVIAFSCNNLFGTYLVSGIVGLLVFQIFQNIAMTIGLMPITGLALPFISYGGSALMTNMLALGIVLNVNMRTRHYMFQTEEL